MFDRQEGTGQVDADGLLELCFRQVIDLSVTPDRGAGDEDVDGTEGLIGELDEGFEVVFIGDIGLEETDAVRTKAFRFEDAAGVVLFRRVEGCHDDVGAALEQTCGDVEAEARRAAGDDGSLAFDEEDIFEGRHVIEVAHQHLGGGGRNIVSHEGNSLI